ncbi:hypothetical protein N7G274_005613 [Stereocaulon virgatum]|uniref:Peptidase A1 domain-containing protein n=1 Tax=Stereocaulon virgatum TaxID=373712 RepID=A0ABR4A8K8_9LECA
MYAYNNIIFIGYHTFIGVGTHLAQIMRAFIDIDWADMVNPSVNCTYCSGNLRYNSSRSSTYESNGTELQTHWGDGFVSIDTITVDDGLHIDHQPFLEAYSYSTEPSGGANTILRLAINEPFGVDPDDQNRHQLPSPFSTLAASKNPRSKHHIHSPPALRPRSRRYFLRRHQPRLLPRQSNNAPHLADRNRGLAE